MRFISAGHPYPLQVGADGAARELTEAQTHPLGLYEFDDQLAVGQTRLAVGEQLVLYSDGVVERRLPHGARLSPDYLRHFLRDRRPSSPSATVRAVHSMVIEASPTPLHDDATVLAVQLLP